MSEQAIEQIDKLISQKQTEIEHLLYARAALFGAVAATVPVPVASIPVGQDCGAQPLSTATKVGTATLSTKPKPADRVAQIAKSAAKANKQGSNRGRHTDKAKLAILEEAEQAPSVQEVMKRHGVSMATYYNWRKAHREGKF